MVQCGQLLSCLGTPGRGIVLGSVCRSYLGCHSLQERITHVQRGTFGIVVALARGQDCIEISCPQGVVIRLLGFPDDLVYCFQQLGSQG